MAQNILTSPESARARLGAWRKKGKRIALVPTMGALHQGHLTLVREAQKLAEGVFVSIFVNPAQFAPHEDFGSYPRTFKNDCAALAAVGVDDIFAPEVAAMYPPEHSMKIILEGAALGLETDCRPHFFTGVATVVAKLLVLFQADVAIFGEKDYQQLQVIRALNRELLLPTQIVGAPTVREADGLALSSRNAYLNAQERTTAPQLHACLNAAREALVAGAPFAETLTKEKNRLATAGFRVDYFEARDAATLAPIASPALSSHPAPVRLLAAAWLGKTRLIDNIAVEHSPAS